jgi:urease accessory protein
MRRIVLFVSGVAMCVIAPVALAHPGHLTGSGFTTGLIHPFTGLDHLLAMTAVGIWAAQRGGKALFAVPASFIGMMAVGGIAGAAGAPLPLVQPGILGSVVVFGLLIALNARLPLAAGMAVVGAFAVFHGYAHAVEMPDHAHLAVYGSGMLLGTAILHAIGIGIGRASKTRAGDPVDLQGTKAARGFTTPGRCPLPPIRLSSLNQYPIYSFCFFFEIWHGNTHS